MLALFLQSPHWYRDAIALSTVFIAVATGVNLLVSIFLWQATAAATKVTRDMFEASQRPYVGITRFEPERDAETRTFTVVAHAQNFGSIPAENVEITKADIVVNRAVVDRPNPTEYGKFTIFPQGEHFLNFSLTARDAVVEFPERLEIHVTLRYEGLNGKGYRYQQEALYHAGTDAFIPLKDITTEE